MSVFIDGYEIDVSVNETHTFDSMITSDPVEKGANITDNIKALPETVTLTGVVSDTPFGQLAERRTDGELNSASALDFLRAIRDAREPVTIETSLRKYESMALERLSVPMNVSIGDSFQFTATFKQIRIITTLRETVDTEQPRGKRKTKRGDKKVDKLSPSAKSVADITELRDTWLAKPTKNDSWLGTGVR